MAVPPRIPLFLYKILPASTKLPVPLPQSFVVPKTALDVESGFIHFSTASQVAYVLNRFFTASDLGNVWLLKINYVRLATSGEIKWEEAGKDRSLFAHLHNGEVPGKVVEAVKALERGDSWDLSLQELAKEGWWQDD
ncbi:MAG: hypothetical protein Q9220_004142 [cf. Caloplaca sp. 1 TL-2023]